MLNSNTDTYVSWLSTVPASALSQAAPHSATEAIYAMNRTRLIQKRKQRTLANPQPHVTDKTKQNEHRPVQKLNKTRGQERDDIDSFAQMQYTEKHVNNLHILVAVKQKK